MNIEEELANGKLMIGESAGAIKCAPPPSIILSKWMKSRRIIHKKMTGLGLINFYVLPII